MIEDLEARAAETLARTVDRKRFFKRTTGWSFATVASLAAGGSLAEAAAAHTKDGEAHCANRTVGEYFCNPPNHQYCSNCNGHACGSGFTWTSAYGYASACWCTQMNGGKYFICCDCASNDGNTTKDCGCAECVGITCGGFASEMSHVLAGGSVEGARAALHE